MTELIPVSDDDYRNLMKIARNWLLMGLGAILLFVITMLLLYFKLSNRMILGFLMVIQFSIIPVAFLYYLKNRKYFKELRHRV